MSAILHLPLDWERAAEIRLLAMKLAHHSQSKLAPLYFVRMWSEWGLAAVEWRPLQSQCTNRNHDWAKEDLTHLIEQFCEWPGPVGGLIFAALDAGVLLLELRGDLSGLVLANFWRMNEHLSPDYKTIQQKGGLAKGLRKQAEASTLMAEQQARIFESQGRLWLNQQPASDDQRKTALALVLRIDRACGRPVRNSSEYEDRILELALEIVLTFTPGDIDTVEKYLYENRDTPSVVKETDRVLMKFAQMLEAAR